MPKKVKMKDPNKVYFSPQDGLVVQGSAVVEFPDPVHPAILTKIANGSLIETDEPATPNTYAIPDPTAAASVPRWVGQTVPGQVIVPAPAMPVQPPAEPLPATLPPPSNVPVVSESALALVAEREDLAKQADDAVAEAEKVLAQAQKEAGKAKSDTAKAEAETQLEAALMAHTEATSLAEHAQDQLKAARAAQEVAEAAASAITTTNGVK